MGRNRDGRYRRWRGQQTQHTTCPFYNPDAPNQMIQRKEPVCRRDRASSIDLINFIQRNIKRRSKPFLHCEAGCGLVRAGNYHKPLNKWRRCRSQCFFPRCPSIGAVSRRLPWLRWVPLWSRLMAVDGSLTRGGARDGGLSSFFVVDVTVIVLRKISWWIDWF